MLKQLKWLVDLDISISQMLYNSENSSQWFDGGWMRLDLNIVKMQLIDVMNVGCAMKTAYIWILQAVYGRFSVTISEDITVIASGGALLPRGGNLGRTVCTLSLVSRQEVSKVKIYIRYVCVVWRIA